MRRNSVCEKTGLRWGAWTQEEDALLSGYIKKYGHSNWRELPECAGLLRCGKSCRLRWMNYLRPNIRRGNFTREEDEIITNYIQIFGNRWSEIAANLEGRTDNEVKNRWHTCLKKKSEPGKAEQGKRVKSVKSKIQSALSNSSNQGSQGFPILESSAVGPAMPQQNPSDFSYSTSDSGVVITENQAIIQNESDMPLDTYIELPVDFWSEPLLWEDEHLWEDDSSVWMDSLLTDSPSLIEEALCGGHTGEWSRI